MSGVESGIDTAVWIVGVLLGLAVVFGPLALLCWIVYAVWRRFGVLHRLRALVVWFTHWRMRRQWERERARFPLEEHVDAVVGEQFIDGVATLVLRRHGSDELVHLPADATPEQINEALKRRQP